MTTRKHILALCGGVGGAKLAFGLTRILSPHDLTIVVNTGDDFEHLGLSISPDIDTVAYTLSDLADRVRGWGRKDETWNFLETLTALGGEDWFQLGDRDMAMHLERTHRLALGQTLSEVTARLTAALGVRHAVIPMSDEPVRTVVETLEGDLSFQAYFVRERCRPVVTAVRYVGADRAAASPAFKALLGRTDIAAVIVCPSNPYLSIDPILAVPGVRSALRNLGAPVVAVSPIIGDAALKGPAAKLMTELGAKPGVVDLVRHYDGLIEGLVIDRANKDETSEVESLGPRVLVTNAVMTSDEDRIRLARETLGLATQLARPVLSVANG